MKEILAVLPNHVGRTLLVKGISTAWLRIENSGQERYPQFSAAKVLRRNPPRMRLVYLDLVLIQYLQQVPTSDIFVALHPSVLVSWSRGIGYYIESKT